MFLADFSNKILKRQRKHSYNMFLAALSNKLAPPFARQSLNTGVHFSREVILLMASEGKNTDTHLLHGAVNFIT